MVLPWCRHGAVCHGAVMVPLWCCMIFVVVRESQRQGDFTTHQLLAIE